MQVQRHHTLTGDIRISIPPDTEYREEADGFFPETSKKTQSLPADTCLLFGSGRHPSQNKIWPQKFFFRHVLQSLEERCSNKYPLLKLTGNEDNYFPLRSGMQCKDFCWLNSLWIRKLLATTSFDMSSSFTLQRGRIYWRKYWRLGLPGNNTHLIICWTLLKDKAARILPPRWCQIPKEHRAVSNSSPKSCPTNKMPD